MKNWNDKDIPNLNGKVVVVTGATSGLGAAAALVLAGKEATVVMAVRNTSKGETVASDIRKTHPNAKLMVRKLDLASLNSVKEFADKFLIEFDRLDVLINNAGVMFCDYVLTVDGLEPQMGVNHFGHFALTGRLMPLLKATPDSCIVVTSSVAHRAGKIDLDDVNWTNRSYKTHQAYSDSKIANLYFTYELSRKFESDKDAPKVTVAHPGWTRSELQRHSGLMRFLNKFFAQDADMGVLPTLRAAFDKSANSGDYFGPSKFFEMHGHPVLVKSNKTSHNHETAKRLWDVSEKVTGVSF